MYKEKLIVFNTITNILLLLILFLGGFVWADSNGVWHRTEDIKPGVFGSDEAYLSDFFIFNNTVRFFKFTQFNDNVEINGNLSVNGNLNITNNLILDSIKNCQGKLISDSNGKIICDNFILNLTDMNPASFNYTRYKVCAENEHCSGTPILCAANAPDSASTMIASSLPIYWGSWSNSQCGTSGNGWYQSHSTCSSAVGNGYAKCNWVLVEINETIEGLFNDSSNEKPISGFGILVSDRIVSVNPVVIQNRVSGTCAVGSYIRVINNDGTVVCGTDGVGIATESDPTVLASVKDGVSWSEIGSIPASFADGVDDVNDADADPNNEKPISGTGISVSDRTVNVNTAIIQNRVSGSCAAGSSIRIIAADGTVTCEVDDTSSGVPSGAVVAGCGEGSSSGQTAEDYFKCWGGANSYETCPAGSTIRKISQYYGTVTGSPHNTFICVKN